MGFKRMREKSGMTQGEVATAVGGDQSAVCLWETGKSHPRAKRPPQIAKLFGCSIEELIDTEHPDVSAE